MEGTSDSVCRSIENGAFTRVWVPTLIRKHACDLYYFHRPLRLAADITVM